MRKTSYKETLRFFPLIGIFPIQIGSSLYRPKKRPNWAINRTNNNNKVLRLSIIILVGNNYLYFLAAFFKLFYYQGLKPRACPIRLQQGDIEDRVELCYSEYKLYLIYLLPYALQDLKWSYKLTIKLLIGIFYTDIFRREQDPITNGEVLSQIVTVIVFYLKLLGIYY